MASLIKKLRQEILQFLCTLCPGNMRTTACSKVSSMFLSPCGDTGNTKHRLLINTWYSTMCLDSDEMMQRFSFVMDCAAVMPTVVEASTSTICAGWYESWSPCVPHILSTTMKLVMKKVENVTNTFAKHLTVIGGVRNWWLGTWSKQVQTSDFLTACFGLGNRDALQGGVQYCRKVYQGRRSCSSTPKRVHHAWL